MVIDESIKFSNYTSVYKNVEEIKKAFREAVALYSIVEYNQSGYGHVEGCLEKYKDVFEKYDFDLDKIEDLDKRVDVVVDLIIKSNPALEKGAEFTFDQHHEVARKVAEGSIQ